MTDQTWRHDGQKIIVCVDSYRNGVLQGRLYHASSEPETFESLTQFLLKMEKILDAPKIPPTNAIPPLPGDGAAHNPPMVLPFLKGAEATFQVQVLFRHNTSWQGVMVWLEEHRQQRFRSALSLILLIDSALIRVREGDAV